MNRAIALILLTLCASVQAQRADTRYEDLSTFKNRKPYIVDPYVWSYSAAFAQLFRMPEKWIDSELKGALAVAFRMSPVGNMSCGYGGKEDNCWSPLVCQIDVYYDNRIKLPWVREDIVRDFLVGGVSSNSHLVRAHLPRRYVPADLKEPRGVMDGNTLAWRIPPKVGGGAWSIAYYDKEFQPTIGVIGFHGLCPMAPRPAQLLFFDLENARRAYRGERRVGDPDPSPMHAVEFSQDFMKRAHDEYVRGSKPSRDVAQRLVDQYLKRSTEAAETK
jgi:hypothetical protein